jgi:hypothetical protein
VRVAALAISSPIEANTFDVASSGAMAATPILRNVLPTALMPSPHRLRVLLAESRPLRRAESFARISTNAPPALTSREPAIYELLTTEFFHRSGNLGSSWRIAGPMNGRGA